LYIYINVFSFSDYAFRVKTSFPVNREKCLVGERFIRMHLF